MAILSMDHPWAFTFGILGNIISLMVYLAPLPTFYRVYRKRSTEGFQSAPYVVTLFSSMMWMYYAFLKTDAYLLITINAVGCVIETVYIAMFLAYAPKHAKISTAKLLLALNVGLFGLVAFVTLLLSKGPLRIHILGWICVAVSLSVFAAPLSVIRLVIRTKSVEFMPFPLSFFLMLSAVVWFLYGLLKKDIYVAVPNVLGFVFGVAQMVLYMAYRNKKPAVVVQELKLPEHVKEVIAKTSPIERAGAEVHPIDVIPTLTQEEHDGEKRTHHGDEHKDETDQNSGHVDV